MKTLPIGPFSQIRSHIWDTVKLLSLSSLLGTFLLIKVHVILTSKVLYLMVYLLGLENNNCYLNVSKDSLHVDTISMLYLDKLYSNDFKSLSLRNVQLCSLKADRLSNKNITYLLQFLS